MMFIDRIEINNNVIKINNNEFLQIQTQNFNHHNLKNN